MYPSILIQDSTSTPNLSANSNLSTITEGRIFATTIKKPVVFFFLRAGKKEKVNDAALLEISL